MFESLLGPLSLAFRDHVVGWMVPFPPKTKRGAKKASHHVSLLSTLETTCEVYPT